MIAPRLITGHAIMGETRRSQWHMDPWQVARTVTYITSAIAQILPVALITFTLPVMALTTPRGLRGTRPTILYTLTARREYRGKRRER